MAELAMAAFAGVGAAATAAVPAISTAMSVLQGVATVGSVVMGVMQAGQASAAGRAAQQDASFQATLSGLDANREATQVDARALEIRREALRNIGAARVAFGASGLDISSGQLSAIENSIQGDANYGLTMEAENRRIAIAEGGLRSTRLTMQGANARAAGDSRAMGEYIGAGVSGARGLLSIVRRG